VGALVGVDPDDGGARAAVVAAARMDLAGEGERDVRPMRDARTQISISASSGIGALYSISALTMWKSAPVSRTWSPGTKPNWRM
jgi:hypothetical protein